MRVLVGWGSSSVAGIGPALDAVLAGTGVRFVNEGSGGERSHHTAARIGAIPAALEFPQGTIPDAGSVSVEASTLAHRGASLKPVAGVVSGVAGVFRWQDDGFIFTRAAPGKAVRVGSRATFHPVLTDEFENQDALLWMGKNDLADGAGATEVIERTDSTAAWLTTRGVRVLIVGHFVNTRSTVEAAHSVRQVNAAHAVRYGAHFVDCQQLLVGPELWRRTGLAPTADDLAEQAAGHKPPSISLNDGHFNTTGYLVVAHAIVARLRKLGWIRSGAVSSSTCAW